MKKIIASFALSTIALAAAAPLASAAPVSSPDTTGDVTFQANPTPPITPPTNPDPTDPDPDPEEPGVIPGTDGPLRFTRVPDISFGANFLTSNDVTTYYAKFDEEPDVNGDTGTYATFFTVEDVRGGTKGWTVTADNDGVFTNAAGTHDINGTIFFDGAQSNIASPVFDNSSAMVPDVNATLRQISTDTSAAVELVSASAGDNGTGQGYGVWSIGYGDDDVTVDGTYVDDSGALATEDRNPAVYLEVPSQMINTDEVYTTVINWTLGDLK